MTGHSIFAHSRAPPCEGFCLIIIKYLLSEYLQNKSAQILCPVIKCGHTYELLRKWPNNAVTEIMRQGYMQKNLSYRHRCMRFDSQSATKLSFITFWYH